MNTDDTHPDAGHNRRRHERIPADRLPHVTARVVGGPEVRLLDLSRRGARLETTLHLRPGRSVCVRLVADDTTVTLSGAVVRSRVAVVDETGVRYQTALAFSNDVPFCPDEGQDAALGTLRAAGGTDAIDADGGVDIHSDAVVMIVPSPGETGHDLCARLLANCW